MDKFPQVLLNVKVARALRSGQRAGRSQAAVQRIEQRLAGEGRVVLRASGTEPVIRVMVEGRDEAEVRGCADELAEVVRAAVPAARPFRPDCGTALRTRGRRRYDPRALSGLRRLTRTQGSGPADAAQDRRRQLEDARVARRQRVAGRGDSGAPRSSSASTAWSARRSSIWPRSRACCATRRSGSGAQDVCAEAHGAFTGEVSAAMLQGRRLPVRDRRPLRAARAVRRETIELVARKFAAAHVKGLVPILCVGEQLAEREAGRTQRGGGAAARSGAGAVRHRRLRRRRDRLRAGLGDRHRPHRHAGAGAGGPRLHPRAAGAAGC